MEILATGLGLSVDWLPDGRTVLTSTQGVVVAGNDNTLTPYGGTGRPWNEIVVDRGAYLRQRGGLRPHVR